MAIFVVRVSVVYIPIQSKLFGGRDIKGVMCEKKVLLMVVLCTLKMATFMQEVNSGT